MSTELIPTPFPLPAAIRAPINANPLPCCARLVTHARSIVWGNQVRFTHDSSLLMIPKEFTPHSSMYKQCVLTLAWMELVPRTSLWFVMERTRVKQGMVTTVFTLCHSPPLYLSEAVRTKWRLTVNKRVPLHQHIELWIWSMCSGMCISNRLRGYKCHCR